MTDYNSLKSVTFPTAPEPRPSVDGDHMASRHPNELANRAAVTVGEINPTGLPGPVDVGGLKVLPGKAAPQFGFESKAGLPKPIPMKLTP